MILSKNNILRPFLLLLKSRKEIIFGITWSTSLATVIAGRGFPPIYESVLSIFAAAMLFSSVYIYNDIIDREMDAYSDKEKKKGRPIAHEQVTVKTAYVFMIVTGLIGLLTSFMISMSTLLVAVSFYIIFFLYSYPPVRFKKMYIIKNVVTAATVPTGILMGGTAVNGFFTPTTLFITGLTYVFMFLILPAGADCLDIEEDQAFQVKTIGGTLSWRQNLILFDAGVLILIIVTALTYQKFAFSYLAPLLITGFGVPLLLYSTKLMKEDGVTAAYKLRPVAYSYLMLVPLFIALGSVF
jgi:4-hydroxybenzoate polyprenyltransferase